MAKLIDSLVEYMLAARQAKLPAQVVQKGKSHTLDSLAAIVSGSSLEAGTARAATLARAGRQGRVQRIGIKLEATPIVAAFANGMSGHADETDDSNSQLTSRAAQLFLPHWRWPNR